MKNESPYETSEVVPTGPECQLLVPYVANLEADYRLSGPPFVPGLRGTDGCLPPSSCSEGGLGDRRFTVSESGYPRGNSHLCRYGQSGKRLGVDRVFRCHVKY